ncbi:hypothetical protein N7508_005800 [Penicillium antarcticum]|uniref:uncharacterized protein n=1 Tax=Penicillium antarcticum TaxID=416450 RepID=UPI0023895741|nr:uncharacterized protein N7508_005800 [Penicillium antarcticum]KAJ5306785.1 hypothetical protein N7508_005800 [Penicillium antarcticum]
MVALAAFFGVSALAVDSCTNLPALANEVAEINVISASWTSSNDLVLSDSSTGAALPNQYAFCRVKGNIEYSGNKSLGFELWLPEQDSYNERYLVVGNGGLAGTIDTSAMMLNLNRGYAVTAGHSGHDVALNADAQPVEPKDLLSHNCTLTFFDGIYTGSPGNWYSHLILSFLWNAKHTKGDGYLGQSILNFTTNAVLEECDGIDGVVDDSSMASSTNVTCLTQPQINAIEAIYAGPTDSRNGDIIYPGCTLGSEKEWLMQETSLYLNYTTPILQNLVLNNLSFDINQFDFGADVDAVDAIASPLIDGISTDLSAFRKRGGKMIVAQGWADPYGALWSIMHLEQLQNATANEDVSDFFNLFMIPGGGHCGPATNFPSAPSTYHTDDVLRAWVENNTFPDSILTSHPLDGSNRTRRICPWPQSARLKHQSSDSDYAENFVCA